MAPKPFESKIQDLVYNLEVGIGARLIKTGLYLLFVLFVMLMYTATQFRGLKEADAMEYAQLGRNLLYHHRLLTQCVRPITIWYMKEKSPHRRAAIMHQPDVLHPPLYPLLLAAAYRVTSAPFPTEHKQGIYPAEQRAVIPLNHFFTLASGLLMFLLARRLFDRRVALVGVTLFFLSDTAWRDSISGTGLPLLTLLTVSMFLGLVVAAQRFRDGENIRRWIVPWLVAAVAAPAAFLTRYGAFFLAPMGALFVWTMFGGRQGRRWAIAFIVIFLAGISPWLVRNLAVTGGILGLAPYTALADSHAFAADSFWRTLHPTFKAGTVISSLQIKWLENTSRFYQADLRLIGDGLVICMFLVSFFYRFVRRPVHLLRWSFLLGIVLLIGVAGFYGESTSRLLHVFWPLIIPYGVAFFFLLLDRLQLRVQILNTALTGLFVSLAALPLVFALLPPRVGFPYPPYYPPIIVHVSHMLERKELLCTDMPWATAWYGDRVSLQLPETLDEFYEVNDLEKNISAMYFTTITRNKAYVKDLLTGPERSWFPILEGRIPGDFPLTEGFPIYNMDQLFLTDRKRWEE